jgi:hypothetical protein
MAHAPSACTLEVDLDAVAEVREHPVRSARAAARRRRFPAIAVSPRVVS